MQASFEPAQAFSISMPQPIFEISIAYKKKHVYGFLDKKIWNIKMCFCNFSATIIPFQKNIFLVVISWNWNMRSIQITVKQVFILNPNKAVSGISNVIISC